MSGRLLTQGVGVVEWFLYIPQSRAGIDDLVLRARTAEAGGFDGVAFLDHLETPMACGSPISPRPRRLPNSPTR